MSAISDFLTTNTSPWSAAIATGLIGGSVTAWYAACLDRKTTAAEKELRWGAALKEHCADLIATVWDVHDVHRKQRRFHSTNPSASEINQHLAEDISLLTSRQLNAHLAFARLEASPPTARRRCMTKDQLDKCPLDGDLPDGTCKYVGHAYREGFGVLCKQHDYRYRTYGDPYAKPLSNRAEEPTYVEIMAKRVTGSLSRNI